MKRSTLLWGIIGISIVTSAGFAGIWSDPVLLTELNDPVNGAAFYPHLSRDGQTLYFGRYESGERQLFTATRDLQTGTFSNIDRISELFGTKSLYTPWVSNDDLRLYYGIYIGGATGLQLRMAERNSISDPWAETMAFTNIHIDGDIDAFPSLSPDELTMYYQSDRNSSTGKIWMATRTSINEQFSNPVKIMELDNGYFTQSPCILPDGLTIYFTQTINSQKDIFLATRDSVNDPFTNIEALSLNTPSNNEMFSYITPDESEIFYTTDQGIMYSYQVPEPATLGLLAFGGLLLRKRK